MNSFNSENDTKHSPRGDDGNGGVQEHVNAHFDSTASYWDRVYRDDGLQGLIYRQRQEAVLAFADVVDLSAGCVLEIGCGAGHLTLKLAEAGVHVDAVDASQAMVDVTADRAREGGLQERVSLGTADVHALPFGSDHFDLVVAVGVIPWLHTPGDAIHEMARVLRPGGALVLTADNRARLTSFTDPRAILALSPLKHAQIALRRRRGLATSRLNFPREVDRLLVREGLRPDKRRTVGFGPLSFIGRSIFSDPLGIQIHNRLQALADRGVPGLKWTGWHYVVCATKL